MGPSPTFPIVSYLAIALGFPPGSGVPSEPSHAAAAPALVSAAPSSASLPDTAPKAAKLDMAILVSIADRRCRYYMGSNSLSQLLLGVHVIYSPALSHGQDPW